jgi:DNA-binding NarL/FixJ family response regulator
VSSKRGNRRHQVSARAGSTQPAGRAGPVVVPAPETASGSPGRRWTVASHAKSRSTRAGSAPVGALLRVSSSLSSGVLPQASTTANALKRMPIPSGRSAKPRTAVACPQNEVEPVAEHPLSEALSPAEARVLRYLPTLLSLREIGDELYLSVNTIKVHVRHIYAKLEVHSRRGAAERARALGLL